MAELGDASFLIDTSIQLAYLYTERKNKGEEVGDVLKVIDALKRMAVNVLSVSQREKLENILSLDELNKQQHQLNYEQILKTFDVKSENLLLIKAAKDIKTMLEKAKKKTKNEVEEVKEVVKEEVKEKPTVVVDEAKQLASEPKDLKK